MHYNISYTYPHKHFIDVELTLENVKQDSMILHLPAWRPGRYELQNYAKNIIKFNVKDGNSNKLKFIKSDRNTWKVDSEKQSKIVVSYSFFAKQMDAGGSLLDENQLYLNFINCLVWAEGKEKEPCTVNLNISEEYKIACGLKAKGKVLHAKDYSELIDAPMFASKTLQSHTFSVQDTSFTIHIQGDIAIDWKKKQADFTAFIKAQLEIFGEFPEPEYHFLFQILPYRHYHGVEHRHSTVITLGPDTDFDKPSFYKSLLGISCHELFHAWNICKIRPAEMMPYNLTKENYFPTGFVAEGVTTYYGDILLARSGVWTSEAYFEELNDNLQKHMSNPARNFVSLAETSLDLWVDGYQPSNPYRKVSIYDKGALIALILDVEIRRATKNKKSLDDVMRALWQDFGKKEIGYTIEDYKAIAEKVSGISLQKYVDDCIYGTTPLENVLARSLDYVGCIVEMAGSVSVSEDHFGIRARKVEDSWRIESIATGSPADKALDVGDEITEVNRQKITGSLDDVLWAKQMADITIMRSGKLIHRVVLRDGGNYFLSYRVNKNSKVTETQKANFKEWMGQAF
jgi:predicted metalloprotease with PDZ domain